jgi:hypothetical protein
MSVQAGFYAVVLQVRAIARERAIAQGCTFQMADGQCLMLAADGSQLTAVLDDGRPPVEQEGEAAWEALLRSCKEI